MRGTGTGKANAFLGPRTKRCEGIFADANDLLISCCMAGMATLTLAAPIVVKVSSAAVINPKVSTGKLESLLLTLLGQIYYLRQELSATYNKLLISGGVAGDREESCCCANPFVQGCLGGVEFQAYCYRYSTARVHDDIIASMTMMSSCALDTAMGVKIASYPGPTGRAWVRG